MDNLVLILKETLKCDRGRQNRGSSILHSSLGHFRVNKNLISFVENLVGNYQTLF